MVKDEEKPYGYIYRATNRQNGKNYIGQTATSRWKDTQNPIEERWKEEVGEAYRKERRGEELRNIEKAIIKYGPENFDLRQEDIAHNQKELDEKETEYIKDYNSMNPNKGYNMTEGGQGGIHSPEVKEKLSTIGTEKWQEKEHREKQMIARSKLSMNPEFKEKMTEINRERAKDPNWHEKMSDVMSDKWQEKGYQEKQGQERHERANNPEFIEKMTEINRERAKTPEYQEKMSEAMSNKWLDKEYQENISKGMTDRWQEKEYQENVSKGMTDKWQDMSYREKQSRAKSEGKREIPDKRAFLQDIHEMKKKDINAKYDMDGKSINKRIKEMLGHRGVNNFSEGKDFLKDKNLDDIANEINEREKDVVKNTGVKKEIPDKREFLEDVQNMLKKEIDQKYGMDGKTINNKIEEMFRPDGPKNYTELKEHLQHKSIDEVLKEIEEKSIDQQDTSQSTESSADESPPESNRGLPEKEDTEDSKNKDEQSDNIDGESGKDSTKEPNAAINDIPNDMDDYKGINEFSHDEEGDIGGINEGTNDNGKDFAGINDISDDHLKDFEGINEPSERPKDNVDVGDNPSKDDKERDIKEIESTPAAKESREELKADIGSEEDRRDFEYA